MTEEEAKKRWCPFARVLDGGGTDKNWAATNRHAGEKTGKDGKPRFLRGNSMCIASQCMAWRSQGHAYGSDAPPGGYCGLAGAP